MISVDTSQQTDILNSLSTESNPSSAPLGAELLHFRDYLTRPDLDLPLFGRDRISKDTYTVDLADNTKQIVSYKLKQPMVFRGRDYKLTDRMNVGDQLAYAFDSKGKLTWIRFKQYNDPQRNYQLKTTNGKLTFFVNDEINKTTLEIRQEDLNPVIAGKIRNFNEYLTKRVKFCRLKEKLLSRISIDGRTGRRLLNAVTLVSGLTAIVLTGDLLANHLLQIAVASDNTRNPALSSPIDNPSIQISPTPPTVEMPPSVQEPLYVEKLPDGTIHFSNHVDLITDENLVGPNITPKMIIIHWDGNEDPDRSKWLSTTTRYGLVVGGNSATFAVGEDGVLQLVKMTDTQVQSTTASTGRDDVAINIEMSGSWFDKTRPSETEIKYAVDLIARLMLQYNLTMDDVRGHFQEDTTVEEPYSSEQYHAASADNPDAYDWGKSDPGAKFLADLKERVQKRLEELLGKTGSVVPSVKTRVLKQFDSTVPAELPPHIEIRRDKATGWSGYYDTLRDRFLTPAQLREEIKWANDAFKSRDFIVSSQDSPVVDKKTQKQINDVQLATLRDNLQARQQVRASEKGRLKTVQRQARINPTKTKGGRV